MQTVPYMEHLRIIFLTLALTLCYQTPVKAVSPSPADGFFIDKPASLLTTLKPLTKPEISLLKEIVRPEIPGNLYAPGNCTWFAKSMRMDLPNNLGNANTWAVRASEQGWTVSPTPHKKAIGVSTVGSLGHVVYVESVNSDGTVSILEMNYSGYGIVSSRVAQASEFTYILL